MLESQAVSILMEMAKEEGYTWRIVKYTEPLLDFLAKTIRIMRKDLTSYHVLHEVAHIYVGITYNNNPRKKALNEVIAEQVVLMVQQEMQLDTSGNDPGYIDYWLGQAGVTQREYDSLAPRIQRICGAICTRMRREYNARFAFSGRSGAAQGAGYGTQRVAAVAHKSGR
jgi:hypothetical protein